MMTDEQQAGVSHAPPRPYDAYAYMAKDATHFDAVQTPPGGTPVQRPGLLGKLGAKRVAAVVGVVACALAIGGVAVASTRGTPQSNFADGGGGQFRGGQGFPGQGQGQGQGQLGQGQGQGRFGPPQGQQPQQPPALSNNGTVPALPPNRTTDDGSTDSSTPVTTSLTT